MKKSNKTVLLKKKKKKLLSFQIMRNCQEPWGIQGSISTHWLLFTSASGCRASENFDISSEYYFFPIYANKFCDAGQVPILRYFEACV